MNRAEATLALIAGKKIVRVFNGVEQELVWDPKLGIMLSDSSGRYLENVQVIQNPTVEYREAREPRVFIDVWEEAKTFEEAEPAGADDHGRPLALYVYGHGNGSPGELNSGINGIGYMGASGYWVRRKPDAAKEAANAAAKKLYAAEERVKLLDGLLDEALTQLEDFVKWVSPQDRRLKRFNCIHERRAGK